jgi:hypothetical protein
MATRLSSSASASAGFPEKIADGGVLGEGLEGVFDPRR